jgi:hypothetical protein
MALGGGQKMRGLLGNDFADPRTQGILGLAGGLLSASGPSVGRPVSLGQALGSGLQMGQTAFNQAQTRADQKSAADLARSDRLAQQQLMNDYRTRQEERQTRLDALAARQGNLQVVGGNLFDVSDPSSPKLIETPRLLSEDVSSDGRLIYSTGPDGKVTVRKSGLFDVLTEEEAANKKPKVLSSTLQKVEDEDFEALNTSASIVDDTQGFLDMIDNDQLDFSFGDSAGDAIALALGSNNEEVLNRQDFNIFLERLRNATLRLNKGTQTEGDAERALKEISRNKNNKNAVRRALLKLREVNERAIENKKRGINRRRSTQGIDAFDFSDTMPATSSNDVGYEEL